MPHGGWAGTLAGDVFGQPGRPGKHRKFEVTYYYNHYHVSDQDGWIVAASRDERRAQREVNRLNRGGAIFKDTVCSYDLDWAGRAYELRKFLARHKKKK